MITVTIRGVNRTDFILWQSLRIENLLTKEIDRCTFTIRNYSGNVYKPIIGNVITITDGATTVFGGVIVRITERSSAVGLNEYDVECSDYTRILDQHLVAETYQNTTINAIIADLVANWMPTGFTTTQVDAPVSIDYIQFKYEPASDCLRQLAELVGYDWYVDYAKDIYFKIPTANAAPFDIEDTTGTYINDTLVIRRDNSQMRNSIIVRGGEYLGTLFTASVLADGIQTVFNLPYRYTDFRATLTGNPLTVGVDGIDDANNYHALYNFNEKVLRFKEDDKPSLNSTLSFSGRPHLPVIVKLKDQAKIDAVFSAEASGDGKYEYLVVDKSINSKEGARDRANAEIRTYGDTLSEGEFTTWTSGLRAGQRILINSTLRSITSEYFVINRVTSLLRDPNTFIYNISLITTKTMNFISIMKKLLLAETKKIEIKENELLDLVEAASESVTLSEVVSSSVSHNPQSEAMSMAETFTPQSLNYDVQFVLGPYTPTGTKRVFILDGSKLG